MATLGCAAAPRAQRSAGRAAPGSGTCPPPVQLHFRCDPVFTSTCTRLETCPCFRYSTVEPAGLQSERKSGLRAGTCTFCRVAGRSLEKPSEKPKPSKGPEAPPPMGSANPDPTVSSGACRIHRVQPELKITWNNRHAAPGAGSACVCVCEVPFLSAWESRSHPVRPAAPGLHSALLKRY
uniref:Uncharacterized protein n=1 Tax=Anser brachyrhynchus TaxID=132585 RepID=A0A8B9B9X5_9AVES